MLALSLALPDVDSFGALAGLSLLGVTCAADPNPNTNSNPSPNPNLNPNPDPNPDPDPDSDPNQDPNPNPNQVGLDAPLAHAHHGETEVHSGHTLELRAEVGV